MAEFAKPVPLAQVAPSGMPPSSRAIVVARNTIFVRQLSPAVTERVLRQTFAQCDHIEQVLFRAYPGRVAEYYAQVDFRSSKGVVEAHQMTGTPILGVKCLVGIVDPGSKELLRKVTDAHRDWGEGGGDLNAPAMAEPQGVQLEYIRRYQAAAEAKRLKTVHATGLKADDTEAHLRRLCSQFGEVQQVRLDVNGAGERFALVEFASTGPAKSATSRQGFTVDDRVISFTEAKTMIDTNEFVEQSVHFVGPAYDTAALQAMGHSQGRLSEKVAKAKAAAAEIAGEAPPPDESETAAAAAEGQPVQWPGRSERDLLQELIELAKPRPQRERRREGSRRRRRPARSREREGRRGRRRRRDGSNRTASCAKRSRKPPVDAGPADAGAVDVEGGDGLDLAVVPNTELLVLGESSSSSSDFSDDPTGDAALPGQPAGADLRTPNSGVVTAEGGAAAPEPRCGDAAAVDVDCAEPPAVAVDVEEKDQWMPPIDADEDGSCDEIVGAGSSGDEGLEVMVAASEATASVAASSQAPGNMAAASMASVARPADVAPAARLPPSPVPAAPALGTPTQVSLASSPKHWECTSCGEVNGIKRDRCNNCGGEPPWLTVHSPAEDDNGVDELSSGSSSPSSSPSRPAPRLSRRRRRRQATTVGPANLPTVAAVCEDVDADGGIADVADSPVRDVDDSPARSVAESGEPAAVSDVDSADGGGVVDIAALERQEADELTLEAERVRGEVADARARVFHGAG